MTRVAVVSGRARDLDALDVDALVLPMFAARVQPRGVAGHADWRLCGRIAQLLRRNTFQGAPAEALLMPTAGRVRPPRVFLFGLGAPEGAEDGVLRERFTDIVRAVVDAGGQRHAVGFPVTPGRPPEAEHAVDVAWAGLWLEATAVWRATVETALLLDDDGTLARATPTLRERARDLGLRWDG